MKPSEGANRPLGGAFALALVLGSLAVSALVAQGAAPGPQSQQILRLENAYIVLSVNASADGGGRFAIGTTGGNPDRPDDDLRPLLYGVEEPWTSFTTVRIGNADYVFGGETHRPAGQAGPFGGQPVTPPRLTGDGRAIEAAWEYPPGVEVLQRLSLVRGPTTGLPDTVRIEYVITNRTREPQSVGLRIMLDTMAGSNDGAPFRVGERAIESDAAFGPGQPIPGFFQVFDSLDRPAVVAQATLRGEGLTPPDRVYFSNWGALRESLWNFDFSPGRPFGRKGEEHELDSAVALFFEPRTLGPGQSRSVATLYGLGGISIAPGQLTVGLSGPEVAVVGQPEPLTLVAYVQNTGQGTARNLNVTLDLPEGLSPAAGERLSRTLAELPAGQTMQAAWEVLVTAEEPKELTYTVVASADNAEANRASRTLRVLSPARIELTVSGPASLSAVDGRWEPVPFPVEAELVNVGGSEATGLALRLITPFGLKPAPGSSGERFVGPLGPQERYRVRWLVVPTGASGNLPYAVRLSGLGSEDLQVRTRTVMVPPLESALRLRVIAQGRETRPTGEQVEAFNVAVEGIALGGALEAELELAFDPSALRVAGGVWGVDGPPRGTGSSVTAEVDPEDGRIRVQVRLGRAVDAARAVLAVVRFAGRPTARAGAGGPQGPELPVRLLRASVRDSDGRELLRLGSQGHPAETGTPGDVGPGPGSAGQ